MRRALLPLAILAVFALGGSSSLARHVGAAGPQPLMFPATPVGGEQQSPIEQQSDFPWLPGPLDCSANERCIVNPTSCRWDVDDHWQVIEVDRYLDGGVSTSMSPCIIADADQHYRTVFGMTNWWSTNPLRFGVHVRAPSPNLAITVAYAPQGRTFTVAAVYNQPTHDYIYEWCGQIAYLSGDPVLGPIAGSGDGTNGLDGVGLLTTITVTVANPTNKRIRDIGADIQNVGVGASDAGCHTGGPPTAHIEYPFRWSP